MSISMSSVFNKSVLMLAVTAAIAAAPTSALAQGKKTSAPEPKDSDVSAIREKYWARGDESELGVVQNRLYSKSGRVQLTAFGGIPSSDPFLSVKGLGGSLGYYFNEYLSLHAFGWKAFVGPSQALETIRVSPGVEANTNEPKSFVGGEVGASFLYGKLSLAGKAIIHYDLHVLAGAGLTSTETGRYLTPSLGLGQQIYLNQHLSLLVNYRKQFYREGIPEKVLPATRGTIVSKRDSWTDVVTVGVGFLF